MPSRSHHPSRDSRSFGDRLSDSIAAGMGSWAFIIAQTLAVVVWMTGNVIGFIYHWDAYPFILLNLLFSTQAAYAAPIIMMSQNRQEAKDRERAQHDLKVNEDSDKRIKALEKSQADQHQKLDRIGASLTDLHEKVDTK